jgi:hypothetical protein
MIKNKKGSWPVNEENKKIECWVRGFQEFAKRRHPHAKAVLPVFFHIAYCLKAGQSSTCLFSQILQSISFYFIIPIASESVGESIGIRTHRHTVVTGIEVSLRVDQQRANFVVKIFSTPPGHGNVLFSMTEW